MVVGAPQNAALSKDAAAPQSAAEASKPKQVSDMSPEEFDGMMRALRKRYFEGNRFEYTKRLAERGCTQDNDETAVSSSSSPSRTPFETPCDSSSDESEHEDAVSSSVRKRGKSIRNCAKRQRSA